MRKTQTPLILSTALMVAFAASAFAQDATTGQQQKQSTPPQDTTQSQPPANSTTGDQPPRKSWSDLDTDGNGSLSASEAAALDSTARIFPKADADGNGELTGDEYKAWLAANGGNKDVPKK